MNPSTNPQQRSFWRTPVAWLVIALPLASIIAGVGLVIIAVRSGGADVVTDKVQRVSQIQTTDLGPDQRALAMKLSAVLRIDKQGIEVIPVTGDFNRQAPLELRVLHPTLAQADQTLRLAPGGQGWRVETQVDESHDWNLQLAPADGSWRLKARLPKTQHAVRLAPSLQDDPVP